MVRWAAALLALCATSAASAPPPPPPPPPSSMDVVVDGHNLAAVFGSYRTRVNDRIKEEFEANAIRRVASAAAVHGGVDERRRSISFSIRGLSGLLVEGIAAQYCDANSQANCRWHLVQTVRNSNAVTPADFDAAAAAGRLAAAGIQPSDLYGPEIVDVIGGFAERSTGAQPLYELDSARCPALLGLNTVWTNVPRSVEAAISDMSPSIRARQTVVHGPFLTLRFAGRNTEVMARSGVEQPTIVGDTAAVLINSLRECDVPEWPSW